MKEYDIYLPLNYNDGSAVEPHKIREFRRELIAAFGRFTHFTQPAEGHWEKGGEAATDAVVIYRVLAKDARKARPFFGRLKERLKESLRQEEVLITERDVRAL